MDGKANKLPTDEIFAAAGLQDAAGAAARRGKLRRIVQGVYTRDLTTPLDVLVRTRLFEVVAAVRPGAVIADRSAVLGGKPTADNLLFLVHDKIPDVTLPGGIVLRSRRGAGALPSDLALPDGLHMSGQARTALENMVRSRSRGGRTARTLSRSELETWLDRLVNREGDDWARNLRDTVHEIAPALGLEREATELDSLLDALLGTRTVKASSPELAARQRGMPYDAARVALFDQLFTQLATTAPPPALASSGEPRENTLPFVEAYFSNFIEGTEFTFEEAAAIVYDGDEPENRPADAHDIQGTYVITSDMAEMRRTPTSADDLIDLLERRHTTLMAGRPEKRPGELKVRANQAGSTLFVAPRLARGTLKEAFARYAQLDDPFARAAFVMFFVSEVHPFDDGNGRIARIMMNAELVASGLVRIVIPTVYRNNYLMALRGLSHNGNTGSYIAMLSFAQRYTAQLDCSTLTTAQADLSRTNAFTDAVEADAHGVRLVLPLSVDTPI